jgi:PiT family inorganic phosphate transporter
MDMSFFIFLSSGLFLGWSLGANDAANVFGTAVGSKMIKFKTAAILCSIFVILGATIDGAGASHTLGALGKVNTISGAFMAALAAALTVYWMTKLGIPVSTSQAIVGAIIGWNIFANKETDYSVLTKIVSTWVFCPILSALIAIIIYFMVKLYLRKSNLHLIRLDAYTRLGLVIAGIFGSYALGANNIANVMGVFVSSSPFTQLQFGSLFSISGIQVLFLLGGISIAIGVTTYSKNVMSTVGDGMMPMTPLIAWIIVFSQSIVLYLFASQGLKTFLINHNLPSLPLVPVSSSQAVVGAVLGIGLIKGGRGIRWGVLAKIASGWITTPIIAAIICFVSLFFLQNVFNQQVFLP